MSVIVKLLSKFDDSGIKKAKHAFGGLEKALGAVGIGLGLKEVSDLLLESAKLASADEKSQQLLNNQLTKNAHATKISTVNNEKFIKSLSQQVGITKDRLRPAQAKLARVTGDVAESQKLLKLALDASAVSGKPLETVSLALAKAYAGNTGALARMFPELKKSKNALADLNKEVNGAAAQQASPFDRFNVGLENLKEKLGAAVLPLINDFIDQMMKPGGAIDQVGKFLDDLSNPKTDAGKMFTDIKNAVKDAFGQVKDFFALFGNGDAMKGFGNVAGYLVKMLPALLAFKGIMALSAGGKAIQGLVGAIAALRGTPAGIPDGGSPTVLTPDGTPTKTTKLGKLKTGLKGAGKLGLLSYVLGGGDLGQTAVNLGGMLALRNPITGTAATVLTMSGDTMQKGPRDLTGINPKTGLPRNLPHLFGQQAQNPITTNNITINVQSADPKAVVDAMGKYVKVNGKLPKNLFPRN
jgi:hypothetical protein